MPSYPSLIARARFYKSFARRYWSESAHLDRRRVSTPRRLADIFAGHHPREADWYRQRRGDADGGTSNLDREEGLRRLNRHYGYVLDDKAVFCALARAEGLPVPPVAARAIGGAWHWGGDGEGLLNRSLERHGRFVVKPTLGKKGQDVVLHERLSAMSPPPPFDAIATPFVQQHDYAHRIFPGALNTIRVLMVRDDEGPFAAAAVHRFGSKSSGVTDNFSRDGLVARVDVETGSMSEALSVGAGNALMRHEAHPGTGERIEGVVVPAWEEAMALVRRLGEAFPALTYVGWDIAVTEDGPVVVEGNSHPSLRFFQLYDRILEQPRLAAFLQRYLRKPPRGRSR